VGFVITKVPVKTAVWRGFGNEMRQSAADAFASPQGMGVSLLLLRVINS
jgi:hypothetical protein